MGTDVNGLHRTAWRVARRTGVLASIVLAGLTFLTVGTADAGLADDAPTSVAVHSAPLAGQ